MNAYPLRPDSVLHQPAGAGYQLFRVDAREHPPTPGVFGSLAGYEYRLPPLARLAPVIQIQVPFFSYEPPVNELPPPDSSQLRNWLLYTKDPTGKDLMRGIPLIAFLPDNRNRWSRHRILLNHWIDPLQSYLLCTEDNQLTAPTLMFTYGHV